MAEEILQFVRDAADKFNNGSLQIRKGILTTLGQNLILKDKILTIDLDKSLMPMEKVSAEVLAMHKRLEPPKKPMKQEDYDRFYSQNPRLLRGLDSPYALGLAVASPRLLAPALTASSADDASLRASNPSLS